MNPFRRCIVLDVWAVEVLLRSVVVWGVEDFPGVEAAYVNADTRAAAARRGGSRCCSICGVSLWFTRGVGLRCPIVVTKTVLYVFTDSLCLAIVESGCMV